jgi:hypothetical protein
MSAGGRGPARLRLAVAGTVIALVPAVAACSDDGPGAGGGAGGTTAVATFEVAGTETFAIELTTPELVEHARQLLAGEEVAAIPNGIVVRDDGGVNGPWTWHIDPASLEFADMTTEVCDGLPSHVEEGTVTSDRYCPWSATVIAVEER